MVIDLFYILNELDVLEMRLNILDKYVDKFIIVESDETFSGVPKELVFERNRARFDKWKDKIEYYIVNDFPLDNEIYDMAMKSPNTGNHEHYWVREFYIKESARKALKNCDDDDIIFISDIDEIWKPELEYKPINDEVLKPKQLPYLYYLNQRSGESWFGWTGTTCCRYETIKNGIINHIRTDELQKYTVLENGGWHFNSIGGKEQKMNASQHPVVNQASDWNRREIDLRRDENDLPEYILNNKEKWQQYLL